MQHQERQSVEAIVDEATQAVVGSITQLIAGDGATASAQAKAEVAARAALMKIATKGCVRDVLAALAAVGAPGDLGEYHQRLQAAMLGGGR